MDFLAAVDPGANTGVCLVEFATPKIHKWRLWSGPPLEAVQLVEDWLKYVAPARVVCERFTVTNVRHSRQYDALEVIGAMRYLAFRENAKFELQGRSDRLRADINVARQFMQPRDDDQESALLHAVVAAVRYHLLSPELVVVR